MNPNFRACLQTPNEVNTMRMTQLLALTGASAAAALLLAKQAEKARNGNHNESAPVDGDRPPRETAKETLPWVTSSRPRVQDAVERANTEMQAVLRTLKSLGGKPLETLNPTEARRQPGPAEAVNALLQEQGKNPAHLKAESGVAVQNTTYPGATMQLPARIYTPAETSMESVDGMRPVILYFHGGGFVIADLDAYDAAPRALAKKTGAIVVSADYRRAPEHKFPAAHEDAYAAYQWVAGNAQQWGGDPSRIAVAGESAGGNLAANVALTARDRGDQPPVHMLLVYPLAGVDPMTLSYQENARAVPLNKPMMEWFLRHALKNAEDRRDPRINLIGANLAGLPSATVMTAEIDPLRSEGRVLAERLKLAGSAVYYRNFDGVTHEFFGMNAVLQDAEDAQELAAYYLKQAFQPVQDGLGKAVNLH